MLPLVSSHGVPRVSSIKKGGNEIKTDILLTRGPVVARGGGKGRREMQGGEVPGGGRIGRGAPVREKTSVGVGVGVGVSHSQPQLASRSPRGTAPPDSDTWRVWPAIRIDQPARSGCGCRMWSPGPGTGAFGVWARLPAPLGVVTPLGARRR